jgi:hypothetical protein
MYDKKIKYKNLVETYKEIALSEDGHEQKANVMNQLTHIKRNAEELIEGLNPDSEYPSWWVNKLVKSADYLDSAYDWFKNKVDQGGSVNKAEKKDVEESSAAWAKSLETIAKKKQLDKISDKDKATLVKIAQMLAKEKK